MSNYCTNCNHLIKESIANKTSWFCNKWNCDPHILQSLCGNPTKLLQCINENWYESKNKSEVNKLVKEYCHSSQFIFKEMLKQEKKMDTKEMHNLIDAYDNGLTIEAELTSGKWITVTNHPSLWNWNLKRRIKHEQKLRPLKPEELVGLKGKWLRHHKDEQMEGLVTGVNYSHSVVILMGRFIGLEELYRDWTYEDGTPVGVLE
jgi:hypothetical protein